MNENFNKSETRRSVSLLDNMYIPGVLDKLRHVYSMSGTEEGYQKNSDPLNFS